MDSPSLLMPMSGEARAAIKQVFGRHAESVTHGMHLLFNQAAGKVVRWTAKRKAAIVTALECGVLSQEDVETRYGISAEELAGWRDLYAASGIEGLKIETLRQNRTMGDAAASEAPRPLGKKAGARYEIKGPPKLEPGRRS